MTRVVFLAPLFSVPTQNLTFIKKSFALLIYTPTVWKRERNKGKMLNLNDMVDGQMRATHSLVLVCCLLAVVSYVFIIFSLIHVMSYQW